MHPSHFSLNIKDPELAELVSQTEHRILGIWAKDCATRILHYYTTSFPQDPRPQQALQTLQDWIDTGAFNMAVIRKASLDAHAAAREVGADTPARSAARAAGQAVATAHVRTHALAAANYALQAVHRASDPSLAAEAVTQERRWQTQRLMALRDDPRNPLRSATDQE